MTLAAGTPIGKYLVRRKIAEGGMAEIYLCSLRGDDGFEKEVVIKRIRPHVSSDPEFVKMFIAEAQVASRLDHPNVVKIFDFSKHDDARYLAMEYVRGLSLWDVRKLCKDLMIPMPPTLLAHIGSEVARGLHYAHELKERGQLVGLVHRDVTPHNVLLSYAGEVKLTDFGIAKAGTRLTSPGMLKGKFAYMSPEQARGEDVDRRSDVFELGVVLWEMATGGKLFDGDSDVAVLRAVQERVIPPPVRLNPDVPAELDGIIMKALERDVAARYQTAQEMERALAEFVMRTRVKLEDADVGAFLRRLTGDEVTGLNREDSALRPAPAPTAVLGPKGGAAGPASLPPDEDPEADTHLLGRGGDEASAAPRHVRPTVPMHGLMQAIQEKEASRTSTPNPEWALDPTVTRKRPSAPEDVPGRAAFKPTVGMRRAAVAGIAFVGVIALAAGVIAFRQHPGEVAREPSPPPPAVAIAPPPPVDAGAVAAADPVPPAVHAGAPREGAEPAPARAEAAAAAPGTLIVKATPWAQVVIDGVRRGEVDGLQSYRLPPGRHRLRFEHPRGNLDFAVNIEPGRSAVREFNALKMH